MTIYPPLQGVLVPLVTPFATDGRIATGALGELAHAVLEAGATGLVALGTTAEAATLDEDEKSAVVDVCARVCRQRRAPLIVGAGGNATGASVAALADLAGWPEVTAALVPVPYFTVPSAAGVVAHFARLAERSPVPLVVYHVPHRTGQPLDAATLRSLGNLPGVIGIKYARQAADQQTVDLFGDPPAGVALLAGDDPLLGTLLALGAPGGITASAHLVTARFAELVTAWRDGDPVRARSLGHALARLSAGLFAGPNPTVLKGVLHAQGRIPTPDVRLPLLPAGPEAVARAGQRLSEVVREPDGRR